LEHVSAKGFRLDRNVEAFWPSVPEFIRQNSEKYTLVNYCSGNPFNVYFTEKNAPLGGYGKGKGAIV